MPGIHLKGLTQYGGTMTDAELVMYVVKQDDTSLGGANGSGYKLPVSEGLVTTDGTNPVSVNGGGVINLNGGTLDWPGTPVSGNIVVTEGDQTLYNKTLLPRDQEVGPKIDIRHTDLRLIKSQVTDPEDFGTRAIFSMALLDELNDFTYQLPKNDGNSVLVDHQTAQTLTNKTLEEPIINVVDSELLLRDSTGSGRTAKFEVPGSGTEDFIFTLPTPPDLNSTLVDTEDTQTLTNKTLTTPTISATGFSNAQHNHSAANRGGTIDHGALTGRGDDDHTQYYNQARGDARYAKLAHSHVWSDITGEPDMVTSLDHISWRSNSSLGSGQNLDYTIPSGTMGGVLSFAFTVNDIYTDGMAASGSYGFDYSETSGELNVYGAHTFECCAITYNSSTHVLRVSTVGLSATLLNLDLQLLLFKT
jgi:hypothetical protein